MKLRKIRHGTSHGDHLIGLAAIYKVSLTGQATLIGTGFWVTEYGHLVTAWHVIADNIGADGEDEGPIYAMSMSPERVHTPRVLRKSARHSEFDLALSATSGPDDSTEILTRPLPMTLEEPQVGEEVFTHAYVTASQQFFNGAYPGLTTSRFNPTLYVPHLDAVFELGYLTRMERGHVREIFAQARDSVMLPFPCYQSDMPIYSANSGGTVFDVKGRICGVNCSSYEGTDISYHVPMRAILDLLAYEIELIPEDPHPRTRQLLELGLARRARFYPPLIEVFFTRGQRIVLKPIHFFMDISAWIRWWFRR